MNDNTGSITFEEAQEVRKQGIDEVIALLAAISLNPHDMGAMDRAAALIEQFGLRQEFAHHVEEARRMLESIKQQGAPVMMADEGQQHLMEEMRVLDKEIEQLFKELEEIMHPDSLLSQAAHCFDVLSNPDDYSEEERKKAMQNMIHISNDPQKLRDELNKATEKLIQAVVTLERYKTAREQTSRDSGVDAKASKHEENWEKAVKTYSAKCISIEGNAIIAEDAIKQGHQPGSAKFTEVVETRAKTEGHAMTEALMQKQQRMLSGYKEAINSGVQPIKAQGAPSTSTRPTTPPTSLITSATALGFANIIKGSAPQETTQHSSTAEAALGQTADNPAKNSAPQETKQQNPETSDKWRTRVTQQSSQPKGPIR